MPILKELKYLFFSLERLKLEAFDNVQFYTMAYKNTDGSPVNIAVQMDVDEFSRGLMEKI